MSEKKLEVIPPEQRVPSKQKGGTGEPLTQLSHGRGVVGSAPSGFQAEMQALAFSKIASAIRAQTEAMEAESNALELSSRTADFKEGLSAFRESRPSAWLAVRLQKRCCYESGSMVTKGCRC